jgi:lipopolysaccharide export system permease protein
MRLIDRYLFRQLLGPTFLATLALSLVAILAESLSAIGVILNQRQSIGIFVKIIVLAMPQLIVLILPVAVMLAGLITLNRLHRDHELAICFANGMGRWQVISPAIRLSALVALLSLAITLWLQPVCYRALRDTLQNVRTDLVSTMIRPGQFNHPAAGVTVYAQSVDENGTIHNLFIDRRLPSGRDTTVTAHVGRLQRREGTPVLNMRNGSIQELSPQGTINFLSFDNYVLDLRPFLGLKPKTSYKASDKYIHELLFSDASQAAETGSRQPMLAEANTRIASALYVIAFMFLAALAILGGPFNRMGYAPRIAAAAAIALVSRVVGFAVQSAAASHPALNALQYGVPVLVTLFCAELMFRRRLQPGRRKPFIPAAARGRAVAVPMMGDR